MSWQPRTYGAGPNVPPKPPAAEETSKVDLLWGLKAPMGDGVNLSATVYKPHDQKTPIPAIFTLTPYISDSYL